MENINNYNLNYIKYFVNVAKYGSISKSARSLQISQSALSQAMKNLEEELEVKLFNRNTRGIVLTEEGKILYEKALQGVNALKQAVIETKKNALLEANSTFKIAISKSCFNFCITENINEIVKNFPQINFEFVERIREPEIVKGLQNNQANLAVLKTSTDFYSKEIENKLIKKLHYKMAYNPQFFNLKDKMTIEELKKFIILIKRRDGRRDSSWMQYSFASTMTCGDDSTVLSLIKEGVGIGLLPQEIANKFHLKTVEVIDFPKVERNLMACYNSSDKLAKQIAKFIKI